MAVVVVVVVAVVVEVVAVVAVAVVVVVVIKAKPSGHSPLVSGSVQNSRALLMQIPDPCLQNSLFTTVASPLVELVELPLSPDPDVSVGNEPSSLHASN